MKVKELLHPVNNARQMLNNAADECGKANPNIKVIFSNISRARELIYDAECMAGEIMEGKKDDQIIAECDEVIQKVIQYQQSIGSENTYKRLYENEQKL